MFSLSFTFIVLIIVVVINITLALYVYYTDKTDATNKLFSSLSLILSIWIIVMYQSVGDSPPLGNLFWIRLSAVIAVPMSVLFYLLGQTLPSQFIKLKRRTLLTIFISAIAVMLLSATRFVFESVSFEGVLPKPQPGLLVLVFGLYSLVFSILTLYVLIQRYRKASGVERKRVGFLLLGIVLLLSLVIVTVFVLPVFWGQISLVGFAPVYVLIFLILTSISIIKYRLFNIKVIATEAIMTILVLILLFEGLTSGSINMILFKTTFAIVVGIMGIFIVRSVKREIEQKEKVVKLAEALEKANLQLQVLDKQKTEFLSIASHQLRTPMSIIKGYIELIQDGAYGKVTKKTFDVLADMDETNERLVKLIDEFLDISRIEQGRTKFVFGMHDMNELIDSVVKEMTQRATDKGLKIQWKHSKTKNEVCMDDEKVRHVVFNFIDNAIKYSEKGTIKVSVEKVAKGYNVRVKDNGIGFDKVDEANFFQKFYRGKNVKTTNVGGTGLGIYVTKKFMEKHDGTVWAKSEGLGKGGEFGFYIPLNLDKVGVSTEDSKPDDNTHVEPVYEANK